MPELPDIEAYRRALEERITDHFIEEIQIASPFLLRSVDPPIQDAVGGRVLEIRRLGKRIVIALTNDYFLVFHLMIAGRFQWKPTGGKPPGRITLASFRFPEGLLILTEASRKKRASLHLVSGERALSEHDPGGLELLDADEAAFEHVLRRRNRTVKRALTDPHTISGIGNAYSDEILHAAGISPFALTQRMHESDIARLHAAAKETLRRWTEALGDLFAGRFPGPGEITAYREGFAVHGKYGKACPACHHVVQRIRYKETEVNYCPQCQTGGRLLSDRSLARLLKNEWSRSAAGH